MLMRMVSLLVIASLAGACVVDEPVGEPEGMSWSEAETEAPIRRPNCEHLYSCCADTKLGSIYDDPGHTRCRHCAHICRQEGTWPIETYAGQDCQYWLRKYEIFPPRPECR
jgi:hypothetical protein